MGSPQPPTFPVDSVPEEKNLENEKVVKFRIRNAAVRSRIIRRGMWNIADVPMIVSKWSPIVEEAQTAITSMPIWITIKCFHGKV